MAALAIPAMGALASLLGGYLSNKSPELKERQIQRFTPQQQGIFGQLQGGASQGLPLAFNNIQQLLQGSPEAFKAFEAPYQRQFKEQTVPGIAERFAGLGSGSLSSSGFQQALGQAGSSLSEKLASLRGGLQQNAIQQLMGLSGMGLQPQFESVLQQGDQGFGGGIASSLGQIGGLGMNYGLSKLLSQQFQNQQQGTSQSSSPTVDLTGGGVVAPSRTGWF